MNDPIKFLFDENFGEPLVSALADVLNWYNDHPIEIRHLFSFAKSGEADEKWVPKIAPDGWIIVSGDQGRRCGGEKLPLVCQRHKVTHILLSSGLHRAKQFEKIRAILAAWPLLILAANREKGAKFLLRYSGPDKRIILVECSTNKSVGPASARSLLGFRGRKRKQSQRKPRKKQIEEIPAGERLFGHLNGK